MHCLINITHFVKLVELAVVFGNIIEKLLIGNWKKMCLYYLIHFSMVTFGKLGPTLWSTYYVT